MNKKGFTLIEVIGVITVLALILIIAVPSLTKTLKRNQQNKYNNYIDNLKIAAENYVVSKLKDGQFFEEGKAFNYLTLGNLIDAGYVKDIVANPENNKNLSRDTRIKVSKEIDNTFSYDVQEYYNSTSDYDKENLIIHYDSVEYSGNNKFKNLANEIDYDYSNKGSWTEDGIYMDKNKEVNKSFSMTESYESDSITISFNIKSLDELKNGGNDYTYPIILYNNASESVRIGFRLRVVLFYRSGANSVLNIDDLEQNKNHTITIIQNGLTSRSVYINGVLKSKIDSLDLAKIIYNKISISPSLYNLKLNNMLVYNRALSAEEVSELYELDKERFGE